MVRLAESREDWGRIWNKILPEKIKKKLLDGLVFLKFVCYHLLQKQHKLLKLNFLPMLQLKMQILWGFS